MALRRCPLFCFSPSPVSPPRELRPTVNFQRFSSFKTQNSSVKLKAPEKKLNALSFVTVHTPHKTYTETNYCSKIERGQLSPQTPSTLPCKTTLVEPVSLINAPVPAHSFHVPQRPITVSVPERSFCETQSLLWNSCIVGLPKPLDRGKCRRAG